MNFSIVKVTLSFFMRKFYLFLRFFLTGGFYVFIVDIAEEPNPSPDGDGKSRVLR
jgi:hypothetical protein